MGPFDVEGAGESDVSDHMHGPAPTRGSVVAQAGDRAGGAEPETDIAGGIREEEAGVGELEAPDVV